MVGVYLGMRTDPLTELDPQFSAPGAAATPWPDGRARLESAPVSWLSTVRPDGRPHVTTLLTVWLDDALHFCTGATERKARNLAANPRCVVTTGDGALDHGLDVVVEGEAVRVTDEARLGRLADAWEAKYGPEWRFEVADAAFQSDGGGAALVFEVVADRAFGFAKGDFAQTRWTFGA